MQHASQRAMRSADRRTEIGPWWSATMFKTCPHAFQHVKPSAEFLIWIPSVQFSSKYLTFSSVQRSACTTLCSCSIPFKSQRKDSEGIVCIKSFCRDLWFSLYLRPDCCWEDCIDWWPDCPCCCCRCCTIAACLCAYKGKYGCLTDKFWCVMTMWDQISVECTFIRCLQATINKYVKYFFLYLASELPKMDIGTLQPKIWIHWQDVSA